MEQLDYEASLFSPDDYFLHLSQSSPTHPSHSSQSCSTPRARRLEKDRKSQPIPSLDTDRARSRGRFGEAERIEQACAPFGRKAGKSESITGSAQVERSLVAKQLRYSHHVVSSPPQSTITPTKRTRKGYPSNSSAVVNLDADDSDDDNRRSDILFQPKTARFEEKNGNLRGRKGKAKEKVGYEDDDIDKSKTATTKKIKKGSKDLENRTTEILNRTTTTTRPKPRKKVPPPIQVPSSSNPNRLIDLITPSSESQTANTCIPETSPTISNSRGHSRSGTYDGELSASPRSDFKEEPFPLSPRKMKDSGNSTRDFFVDALCSEDEGNGFSAWENSSPPRPAPFPMSLPILRAKNGGAQDIARVAARVALDEIEEEGNGGASASGRFDQLSLEVDKLRSDSGSDDELMLKPSRRHVIYYHELVKDDHPKLMLTGIKAEVFCSKFISTTEKCPYCSQWLPKRQSTELVNRLERLSAAAPSTTDPSLHWTRTIGACKLHRAETHIIPLGEKAGYPRELDASDLERRVKSKDIMKDVEQVLCHPSRSAWFHFTKRDIEDAGGRRKWLSCGMVQSPAVLERLQPGYYGEIGRRIITDVLTSALKNRLSDSTLFQPLEKDDLIHHVLIPEVAVSLTRQDLGPQGKGREGRNLAIQIVKESREYGQATFGEAEMTLMPLMANLFEGKSQPVFIVSDDSDVERFTLSRPIDQNDDDEDDFDRSLGSLAPEQLVEAVKAYDPPRPAAQAVKARPVLAAWVETPGTKTTKPFKRPSNPSTALPSRTQQDDGQFWRPPLPAPLPDPDQPGPVRKARTKTTLGMRTTYVRDDK